MAASNIRTGAEKSRPSISVVIPTRKGRAWLPDCIAGLRAQTLPPAEILVVDNGSRDGSAAWLAAQPDLRLITNRENVGFAAAANQGLCAATAPFVALLNDDTRPDPRWLAALLAPMLANERVGACASLLVFANQPAMVQSAGITIDRAAIAWDRLGGRPVGEAQQAGEIFGASGGAALYRRAMLDEIGLFDERFFAYLEDVDLAWRAQTAGWRCAYVPDALVYHLTSATSGEGSPFKKQLLGRNKVWLVAKNAPLRDLPLILAYDMAAVLYAGLARGEWHHLLGRLQGLRALPAVLAARRPARPAPLEPLVAPWRVPQRVGHLGVGRVEEEKRVEVVDRIGGSEGTKRN
ncbi:MAG: glycosyltransferase family 2 protein [Ardenticatenaceae bacterium]|nr:glycosyltransferase family 2 protein [Ardenticatenaceae bacterium]